VNNLQNKESEIKYFDEWIKKYGQFEASPEDEYTKILAESGVLKEKRGLLLDVGCGSGAFSFRLEKHGFQVVGCDLSTACIKAAKMIGKARRMDVEFIVADIEKIPCRNNIFSVVMCIFVLHHLPNAIARALQQINWVLVPNGKLFFCEPNAFNLGTFIQYHFGVDRTANERGIRGDELTKLLIASGFSDVQIKDVGEIKFLHSDRASNLRKLVRRLVSLIIKLLEKLPYVPGANFVGNCSKRLV